MTNKNEYGITIDVIDRWLEEQDLLPYKDDIKVLPHVSSEAMEQARVRESESRKAKANTMNEYGNML